MMLRRRAPSSRQLRASGEGEAGGGGSVLRRNPCGDLPGEPLRLLGQFVHYFCGDQLQQAQQGVGFVEGQHPQAAGGRVRGRGRGRDEVALMSALRPVSTTVPHCGIPDSDSSTRMGALWVRPSRHQ